MSAALGMKPKRVVFPIAGKGGVGKTTVMATLAEWYASTAYTAELFDMDPDNKAEGCFKALFAKAHKLPALESWTYDRLLGISLESSADVILADLGAAQGHRMIPWFRDFYKVMQESGLDLRWTALGVVDADIASARSVIEWGAELQNTRGLRHCPQPFSGWCRVVLGESEAGGRMWRPFGRRSRRSKFGWTPDGRTCSA